MLGVEELSIDVTCGGKSGRQICEEEGQAGQSSDLIACVWGSVGEVQLVHVRGCRLKGHLKWRRELYPQGVADPARMLREQQRATQAADLNLTEVLRAAARSL